jgi:hypothetical protein
MPLLNYTTTVPTTKTVGEIQQLLVKAGATAVLHEYDSAGELIALSFGVETEFGPVSFRLPADHRPVLALLQKDRNVPKRYRTQEQAQKVAWRIVKDWVEAQLALIATRMVSVDQVFLPYALTSDGRTFYEAARARRFALPPGS